MNSGDALERARLAAAGGDRAAARSILVEAAKQDPRNEQIYLLFAEVAQDRQQAARALEHVLKLNPGNRIALQGLAKLRGEREAAGKGRPVARRKQEPAAMVGRLPAFIRKQWRDRPTRLLLAAVGLTMLLPCAFALLCTLAGSSVRALGDLPTSGGKSMTRTIVAAEGGELSLSDGATLNVPAGALAADTEVGLKNLGASDSRVPEYEYAYGVGSLYEVDLGAEALQQPVMLEIPFDPDSLPKDAEASQVFLAYFDEGTGEWRYAGGTVDLGRHVVRISTDHASIWRPSTWNWAAWSAALHKITTVSIVEAIEGLALLTEECPQQGQAVQVEVDLSRSVLQGCVAKDDPVHPVLRVVNRRAFYVEVQTVSEGNVYFSRTMMGPGEDIRFTANTQDPTPLIVSAEMTQKAGLYLVLDLVISMLPGANQLGFQGKTIACMTERLSDASYFFSAAESLAIGHDGLAASESLIDFMDDEDAVRRVIRAASDCNYGPASTWSFEGIKQIGGAVSAITSVADYVANYLGGNAYSEFSFTWSAGSTAAFTPSGETDLQLLQACLDQGYVCVPVPYEMTGPVDWFRGIQYDPAWDGQEGSPTEYLGLNPDPGTVIAAPLDGYLSEVDQGGFGLTVELPSTEPFRLYFWFAGYHEFTVLAQAGSQVSGGDPIARYEGVIHWDPSSSPVGPDFEYPGIIQVSGSGEGYPAGMPVYPVVDWGPELGEAEWMVANDCKPVTYPLDEVPTVFYDEVRGLLDRSGIEVDPEPTGFMDLSPPLALGPAKVSYGTTNTQVSGQGEARIFTECIYMTVRDNPIKGVDTVVFESNAVDGPYKFVSSLESFLVRGIQE